MQDPLNSIVADPVSSFRIFAFGFLAGSLFAILIMLIFDWVKSRGVDRDDEQPKP